MWTLFIDKLEKKIGELLEYSYSWLKILSSSCACVFYTNFILHIIKFVGIVICQEKARLAKIGKGLRV